MVIFAAKREPNSGKIHVTSPGPGPWVNGSIQAATWRSDDPELPQDKSVIVETYQSLPDNDKLILSLGQVKYTAAQKQFEITNDYPKNGVFYVLVSVADDLSTFGTSSYFTIAQN
ncbi:13469_t:CDS:1 [Ambispora gerdemannii]|uniref:13469_t:CDS:1 n=1 Tax=Ambispora gerdemannii TaxID=144530 RepID=A0A9N9ALK8_9GLOM|nr:13469_t:CDS:1 [Ambispora gerdemannii]